MPSAQVRQAVIALLWIPDGTELYLDAQHKNKFGGLLSTIYRYGTFIDRSCEDLKIAKRQQSNVEITL